MSKIGYAHIEINQHGTPVISDTNTNVWVLGTAHARGIEEDALLQQYDHITRGQLYSALAYFYDHPDDQRQYDAETMELINQHAVSLDELKQKLQRRDQP